MVVVVVVVVVCETFLSEHTSCRGWWMGGRRPPGHALHTLQENHHLASAFTVLQSPDHNFLGSLPKADYSRMRKVSLQGSLDQLRVRRRLIARVACPAATCRPSALLCCSCVSLGLTAEGHRLLPPAQHWISVMRHAGKAVEGS